MHSYRAKYDVYAKGWEVPSPVYEDVVVLDHVFAAKEPTALVARADGTIEMCRMAQLRYVPGEAEFMRDVRALLYLDVDVDGDWWNPDKEWDSATFDALGQLMERYRLVPPERRNDGK